MKSTTRDFTQGKMSANITKMAIPVIVAQIAHLLYNVVDRMFLGRMGDEGVMALTGVGLCFPIITIVTAFTNLCGVGGASLCAIARGRGDEEEARGIMSNACIMLTALSIVMMLVTYLAKKPLLYAFGASDETFPYADGYLTVYMTGTWFAMLSLGMNAYINAQGFGRTGMMSVLIGAVVNIVLDPLFIFALDMGVQGAALATVLSQAISFVWVMYFLFFRASIRLSFTKMRFNLRLARRMLSLGLSNFVMQVTNSAVQAACNSTLSIYGGDIYIAIMTVINSVREIVTLPFERFSAGAVPVLSFNYGARQYARVREGVNFLTIVNVCLASTTTLLVMLFPAIAIRIFNNTPALVDNGVICVRIYFCCMFMMAFQNTGQQTFVSMGYARHAIFFSLLRKAILVVPLTLILPRIGGLGVYGVFLAEPISEVIGGAASYLTMRATAWRHLKSAEAALQKEEPTCAQ